MIDSDFLETTVFAIAEGYQPASVGLQLAKGNQEIEFIMKKGWSLRGRVLDVEGRPVRGVRVMACSLDRGYPRASELSAALDDNSVAPSTTSGADGSYEFASCLSGGASLLAAGGRGYALEAEQSVDVGSNSGVEIDLRVSRVLAVAASFVDSQDSRVMPVWCNEAIIENLSWDLVAAPAKLVKVVTPSLQLAGLPDSVLLPGVGRVFAAFSASATEEDVQIRLHADMLGYRSVNDTVALKPIESGVKTQAVSVSRESSCLGRLRITFGLSDTMRRRGAIPRGSVLLASATGARYHHAIYASANPEVILHNIPCGIYTFEFDGSESEFKFPRKSDNPVEVEIKPEAEASVTVSGENLGSLVLRMQDCVPGVGTPNRYMAYLGDDGVRFMEEFPSNIRYRSARPVLRRVTRFDCLSPGRHYVGIYDIVDGVVWPAITVDITPGGEQVVECAPP